LGFSQINEHVGANLRSNAGGRYAGRVFEVIGVLAEVTEVAIAGQVKRHAHSQQYECRQEKK
jgi:hypothetical protein